MAALREFVADLLAREGAEVDPVGPDGLDVLAPEPVRSALGWPELARLGFGAQTPPGAMHIGLESDWLDRLGALLGDRGRFAERQLAWADTPTAPSDPEPMIDRALSLPNAVWRFKGAEATWTRLLLLAFRYSAVSDEKRDGLLRLGFNCATGAVLEGDMLERLRVVLEREAGWCVPEPCVQHAAGPAWDAARIAMRARPLLERCVRAELEPFLAAMRRRLDRDRKRIHGYHDDLRRTALVKLAASQRAQGDKARESARREAARVAAIEREYAAKLEDLRHNYALRVSVEWVQGLMLHAPVTRYALLIKRRKGERLVHMDWHAHLRMLEAPIADWGAGLGRERLVCDERLHLTESAGQAACGGCGRTWCRACHSAGCPRCGRTA